MFHDINDDFDFSVSSLSGKKFISFIDHAHQSGYKFGKLDELLSEEEVDNKLRISFDDGYDGLYKLFLEYLKPRSIPFTIFMTAGFIGRQADWDYKPKPSNHLTLEQLKELAASDLVTIGSHSMTHPDLTRLSGEQLTYEIMESKKTLEELIGVEVTCFSYPFGRFNHSVIDKVKKAGYKMAFCGVPFKLDEENIIFSIPRIPLYLFDNFFNFNHKVSHGSFAWLEFSKARVIELFSGLTYQARGERRWSNS
jgi:peptidoglycan/xylan/chitin deacetylase (PgdA/CDA1 family)